MKQIKQKENQLKMACPPKWSLLKRRCTEDYQLKAYAAVAEDLIWIPRLNNVAHNIL